MRKNRMAMAVMGMLVIGALTGCGGSGGKDIGQDAAKEAAFADAGVEESQVSRFRSSKDRDDGQQVYEIQFTVDGREYEYEILASDGSILTVEVENLENGGGNTGSQGSGAGDAAASAGASEAGTGSTAQEEQAGSDSQSGADAQTGGDDQNGSNAQSSTDSQNGSGAAGGTDAQSQTGASQNSGQGAQITMEEAKALALERVSGATDQDIKIELEYDDGMTIYEGDIIYQQREYEFEIDADTGNFLKWSEERR